jgi:AraC-like DNA-binding protein
VRRGCSQFRSVAKAAQAIAAPTTTGGRRKNMRARSRVPQFDQMQHTVSSAPQYGNADLCCLGSDAMCVSAAVQVLAGRSQLVVQGPCSMVLCLWGEVRVFVSELGSVPIRRGEMLVWCSGQLHVVAAPGSLALVLHGDLRRFGSRGKDAKESDIAEGATVPSEFLDHDVMSRALRRAALFIVRRLRVSADRLDLADVPGWARGVLEYRRAALARLASVSGRTMERKKRIYARLVRCRLDVLSRPQNSWTMSEMAMVAHYSPCHFQRTFAAVFGQSPRQFVQSTRLRFGEKLLVDSSLSISSIAAAVGFESCNKFTRAMKHGCGLTPTERRRVKSADWSSAWQRSPRRCCQSCGMPLCRDPQGGGTNADGSRSSWACSYCFRDGAFVDPDLSVRDMQQIVLANLELMGIPQLSAGLFVKRINRLERWAGSREAIAGRGLEG